MFETIVVGIDGRPHDQEAAALAQQLADPGARLVAVSIAGLGDGPLQAGTPEVAAAELIEAQAIVDRFVACTPGFEGFATAAPSPGEGLEHVAAGKDADLIVVASSRRSLPGRVFVGPAIWDVLRHARCPVAVAAVGHRAGHTLHQIVVGYDGSSASEAAVREAKRLAGRDGAFLSAVEVFDPVVAVTPAAGIFTGDMVPQQYELARANLDRLRDDFDLHGILAVGHTAHELAEAADDADLLVVGLGDTGLIQRLVAGSTTRALLRERSVPIMFVPQAEESRWSGTARGEATHEAAGR